MKATVEFKVGDAHNLPIKSSSVDLLTCAMAWHWLDAEKFYAERVLKPGGCLAVYSHGVLVNDNDRVRSAFDAFHAKLIESKCFAEENYHVLDNYKAVELPFPRAQGFEFDMQQKSTMDQLIGFMSSVSMYKTYASK